MTDNTHPTITPESTNQTESDKEVKHIEVDIQITISPDKDGKDSKKSISIPTFLYIIAMFLFLLIGCLGFSFGNNTIGKAGIILTGVFFILFTYRCIKRMLTKDNGIDNPFKTFYYYY